VNWLKECLTSDGKISSKRLITLFSFVLIAIGFISNLYFDLSVDKSIFESVQWIVLGGLGATASEKFSKKNKE
jgi:hypothetical protein